MLERLEVGFGEMRHGTGGKFGLQHHAHGVDVVDRDFLEEQVVLHELQRAIERHFDDGAAAGRAGGNGDQALHFKRLERLADRALADLELRLQFALARQSITGAQIALGDHALDFLGDQIGALELFDRHR